MAQTAQIADFQHAQFDRALERLHEADPLARVALDAGSGVATGFDGSVELSMPTSANALPASDRAAAAAVLFLDAYGSLFGIPGWHVLSPQSASPLGSSIWFAFEAKLADRTIVAHVCADAEMVRHVRIEEPEDLPLRLHDEDFIEAMADVTPIGTR